MALDKYLIEPSRYLTLLVNDHFKDYEPAKLIALTAGASFVAHYLYGQLNQKEPWTRRVKKAFFKWMRKLPMVQRQIEEETEKVRRGFEKEMLEPTKDLPDMTTLPDNKLDPQQVLDLTKSYLGCGSFDWKQGTFSGTVYNGNEELTDLMTKVYGMAAWTNPLHPDAFPGVRKMEAEIVRICCDLFNVSNLYSTRALLDFSFFRAARIPAAQ